MAELIKVGAMQLRFLRTKYDTSGALDMFEGDDPAKLSHAGPAPSP
nr:hypothetical protein [Bradyrhizobium diazoefficiens]